MQAIDSVEIRAHCSKLIVYISVSDPKRLFTDPVPSLKGIPDPVLDPTSQVFPDPSQNLGYLPRQRKKIEIILKWDCSTVFTLFFKYSNIH